MNEDNLNLKNDMDWDNALVAMIHLKEKQEPDFDGRYVLPINAYPELLPICAYNCLQYIHDC